ncbi:Meiotic Sister-Chromatid recombination aldehyde dehydrogenase [Spiromyces aspiralis]|uniref:Meiotic Sister-Chromatid recombination aldehyde dehydrogenase n=1 Tax=Spiromyces aspiralis TaxID=68401 RepID=A0ACC1HZJ0_9FUNG|nr:Meiotic Sister-Chromatid recombination aldehyde dehydrogenase [Spiromyces aspiralis]
MSHLGIKLGQSDSECLLITAASFVLGNLHTLIAAAVCLAVTWLVLSQKSQRGIQFTVAAPKEADPDWRGEKILEEPSIRDKGDPRKIICYDPATARYLGAVLAPTPEEVEAKILKAREAQKQWGRTSFEERRKVLRSLCDFVTKHQEEICRVACRDTGKTMIDATLGEIMTTCAKLRWTIEHGERVLAPSERSPGFLLMYKRARVYYQPRGVVAALVSWNYPAHNTLGPVISALFAGNAIVVKASEYVAWSARYFEAIVKECLAAHGHNPDVVQFVTGYAEAGEAITRSKNVDHITFIGSPGVGKQVMRSASENLTPVTLELGGKDCAIVFDDADMKQCVPVLMRGVFQNAGQNCIGIERILVQEGIYDEFVAEMEGRVRKLRVGSALEQQEEKSGEGVVDCGAMTMGTTFDELEALIDDAVSKGARLLVGGRRHRHVDYPTAQYFEPTLLVDVTASMDITQNETFGPIMVVMRFSTEEDALAKAHSSPYGLGSAVFTSNMEVGRRVGLGLRCGMTNVNDFAVNYLCQSLPFGGVGISGFGRFAGEEGLRAMCVEKAYTEDRWPRLIKTPIPPIVDYPIKDARKGYEFTRQIVNFSYEATWWDRLRAAVGLGKIAV